MHKFSHLQYFMGNIFFIYFNQGSMSQLIESKTKERTQNLKKKHEIIQSLIFGRKIKFSYTGCFYVTCNGFTFVITWGQMPSSYYILSTVDSYWPSLPRVEALWGSE